MDPLSITATVVSLTATCVQTAKALSDVKDKFQNANLVIAAICTESTIISASLSQIQSLILASPQGMVDKLTERPDLEATLDQTLTGCWVVFDVLQAEIRKVLESNADTASTNLGLRAKFRYLWSESTMQEILTQLRGLQTALTLLLQLFGTDTMASLKQMMENNTAVLSQIVQRASRLHNKAPSRAPRSIFEMSFITQGFHHGDGSSIATSTLFSFDDEIVNSQIYRRVLAKAYSNSRDEGEMITRDPEPQTESESASKNNLQAPVYSASDVRSRETTSLADIRIEDEKDTATNASLDLSEPRNDVESASVSGTIQALRDSEQPLLTPTPVDPLIGLLSSDRTEDEDDWATTFNVKVTDIQDIPKKEWVRQNMIHDLITSELQYLRALRVLLYLHKHSLYLDSSITTKYLAKEQFPGCEDIYHANELLLYNQMVLRQQSEGPWISSLWDIFQNWLDQSRELYFQYFSQYPTIDYLIRRERRENARFARFLEQTSEHSLVRRFQLDHYLMRPINRMQRYLLMLRTIYNHTDRSDPSQQCEKLYQLIANMGKLYFDCNTALAATLEQVEVDDLFSRIVAVNGKKVAPVVPSGSKIRFNETMSTKDGRFRDTREVRVVVIERPRTAIATVRDNSDLMMTFVFREAFKVASSSESELILVTQFDDKPDIHCDIDQDAGRSSSIELRSPVNAKQGMSIVLYTVMKEKIGALVAAVNGLGVQNE